MGAALDDTAVFDHQDLVGPANRGKPVRDHERRAPLHQVLEPLLNESLRFGIEAGCSLVQDQDARVRQDRASDRHALALAAGELHPALADDGVVLFGEPLSELVHAGNAAGFQDLLLGGAGAREGDVFFDGSVEQERILKHHAELRTVASSRTVDRSMPSIVTVPLPGAWNAATRLMMVDLPEPEGPTRAVTVPGSATKLMSWRTGFPSS